MKSLILFTFLVPFLSFSQEFRWEYKTYMLQEYFKVNSIKELTLDSPSPFLLQQKKIKFIFDREGKLLELQDKFEDDNVVHKIVYEYDTFPFYAQKQYYSKGSNGRFIKQGSFQINTDENTRRIEEIQLDSIGDTIRINRLFFDPNYKLTNRTSKLIKAEYNIQLYFTYDQSGNLSSSKILTSERNNPDSLITNWSNELYFSSQHIMKTIQFQSIKEKLDTAYVLEFSSENEKINQMLISRFIENKEFNRNQYLIYFNDRNLIKETVHLPLEPSDTTYGSKDELVLNYKYFDKDQCRGKHSNDFIAYFFSPIWIRNDFTFAGL